MMKNMTKKIISLVLVMAMMSGFAIAAEYGHESTIILKGKDDAEFITADTALTETDLFDNFKKVMPGDKLQEKVTVKNEVRNYDYITLHFALDLHDEENQPKVDETIERMHDFLSQLTMRIYDENDDHKLVFESTPEKQGELIEDYYLGTLEYSEQFDFIVELEVPATMGNEFENRIGEVDWVFTYSGRDYPEDPTTTAPTTATTTAPTEGTSEDIEDIEDPEVPLVPVGPGGPDSPDTGDHSNMLPYIVMFIVGLMGLILTSKKRKTN